MTKYVVAIESEGLNEIRSFYAKDMNDACEKVAAIIIDEYYIEDEEIISNLEYIDNRNYRDVMDILANTYDIVVSDIKEIDEL